MHIPLNDLFWNIIAGLLTAELILMLKKAYERFKRGAIESPNNPGKIFVGYTETIQNVKKQICENSSTIFYISGVTGVGKTTTAQQILIEYTKKDYLSIIVGRKNEIEIIEELNTISNGQAIIPFIKNEYGAILLDNIVVRDINKDTQRLEKILSLFTGMRGIPILITSRNSIKSSKWNSIYLLGLEVEECIELIKRNVTEKNKHIWNELSSKERFNTELTTLCEKSGRIPIRLIAISRVLFSYPYSRIAYQRFSLYYREIINAKRPGQKIEKISLQKLSSKEKKLLKIISIFKECIFSYKFLEEFLARDVGNINTDLSLVLSLHSKGILSSITSGNKAFYFVHDVYKEYNVVSSWRVKRMIKYIIQMLSKLRQGTILENTNVFVNISSLLKKHKLYKELIGLVGDDGIGWLLNSNNRWPEYRKLLEEASDAARILGKSELMGFFSFRRGQTYRYQSLHQKAIEVFEEGSESHISPRLRAQFCNEKLHSQLELNQIDEKQEESLLNELKEILEKSSDNEKHLILARTHQLIGRSSFKRNRNKIADDILNEAQALLNKIDIAKLDNELRVEMTDITLNIGNAFFHDAIEGKNLILNLKHDYLEKSKMFYLSALILCSKLISHQDRYYAFVHDELGQWELKSGHFVELANFHNQKALEHYFKLGQIDGCGYALDHLGEVLLAKAYKLACTKKEDKKKFLFKESDEKYKALFEKAENYFRLAKFIFQETKKLDGQAFLIHHQAEAIEHLELYYGISELPKINNKNFGHLIYPKDIFNALDSDQKIRDSCFNGNLSLNAGTSISQQLYRQSKAKFAELGKTDWVEHIDWHINNHISKMPMPSNIDNYRLC